MKPVLSILDGNEAAASVAFRLNEVIAIYPITPSSPMGEWSDQWNSEQKTNIYGAIPDVIEMQSEGGAAGALHGALQAGALGTTFTASQGLLLMIPNMYKIAGELTSAVIHVAARTVATHALSIFGDHSDVMAARATGFAMLSANSVQEAHDFACIAQAATLEARIPFLHFFDGFRTSHEIGMIETLSDDDLRAVVDEKFVRRHRERALSPDRPVLRGTAQNPDVFFQAREACNPFYRACPTIVQEVMDRFAKRTGRQYRLFDYYGPLDAERLIILMGSGAGAAEETVDDAAETRRKGWLVEGPAIPAVCCGCFAGGHSRQREVHRGAGSNERTRKSWRAALSGFAQRLYGAIRRRSFTGYSARHWRAIRTFLEGIHARDGEGGVR